MRWRNRRAIPPARHLAIWALGIVVSAGAAGCGGSRVSGTIPPVAMASPEAIGDDNGSAAGTSASGQVAQAAGAQSAAGTSSPSTAETEPTTETLDAASPARATQAELVAPNGRKRLTYVNDADELAARLLSVHETFADPNASSGDRADAGHAHFLAIRQLSWHPEWDDTVIAHLDEDDAEITRRHLNAQRALTDLGSGFATNDKIPAWGIIDPEPKENLLRYYKDTEAETGIEWEYLAAINRIETGLGRIQGLSGAGARGPMQFLPTTWEERGIGEGDIDDPEDAIHAAGRYLVRRGGPADMQKALWGYNNHDAYVIAVSTWASIFADYPDHFDVMYYWPIYFGTGRGDVWLPSGYASQTPTPLDAFVVDNPWSLPIRDRSGS